jgi:signal transduction histidine kinase
MSIPTTLEVPSEALLAQMRKYEKMLESTALVNHILLATENIDEALFKALETIGNATEVDRVYVFENYIEEETEKWFCNQKIEWAKNSIVPQMDNEELQNFPLQDVTPRWVEHLVDGRPINGLVKNFPEGEREVLEPQDIISLLVVPIMIKDAFWGFVGFDNCTTEYIWTDQETAVLTSLAANIGLAIERKRTLSDLEKSFAQEKELNDLKNRFISMISHEIRTPVTSIISSAELISTHSDRMTQDKKLQLNSRIISASNRIISLLEQVLMVGKSDAGELKAEYGNIQLEKEVNELAEELSVAALKDHKLEISFNLTSQQLYLDPTLMRHILGNLLENAAKYSPAGSRISLLFTQNKESLNFLISDEGMGISPDDLAKIYEPFYRSREVFEIEGTGLGMTIVKKSVEAMNGHITAFSEHGKGTSFSVSIPI